MPYLGYPDCLPAVVVGVPELRMDLADELPWAHSISHQHGGYACLQAELFGVILPLQSVPECAQLLAAFEALARDVPSKQAFASFPELLPLHLTAGQPYDTEQLAAIREVLARALPQFVSSFSGTEAFIELRGAVLSQFFGWPLFMAEMPLGCALDDVDAKHLDIGPLGTYRNRVLTSAALQRLSTLVGVGLSAYLLWDNSD